MQNRNSCLYFYFSVMQSFASYFFHLYSNLGKTLIHGDFLVLLLLHTRENTEFIWIPQSSFGSNPLGMVQFS